MMVLIGKKFNEEQLLLETFFPEMHIKRDIRKKVISRGLKPHNKSSGWGSGVSIYCLENHSLNIFRTLQAHFAIFFPHLPSLYNKESFPFLICRREMKQLGEL